MPEWRRIKKRRTDLEEISEKKFLFETMPVHKAVAALAVPTIIS